MAKVSTLLHRVDGFDENTDKTSPPKLPEPNIETQYSTAFLEPLLFDPGEEIVQRLLLKV